MGMRFQMGTATRSLERAPLYAMVPSGQPPCGFYLVEKIRLRRAFTRVPPDLGSEEKIVPSVPDHGGLSPLAQPGKRSAANGI